jgi:hypothetical protein
MNPMKKILLQITAPFKRKRPTKVIVRSNKEETILEQCNSKLSKFLHSGVETCSSISSYLHIEKGAIEIIKEHLALLSQHFDALWLSTTNEQEKDHEKFDLAQSQEKKITLIEYAKRLLFIDSKSIQKRKQNRLSRLMERLSIYKKLRSEYESNTQALSDKLLEKINHRTQLKFRIQKILLITGIIIASTAEAGNAMNSLQVLRSNPALELFTVLGISLALVVLSKGIIYVGNCLFDLDNQRYNEEWFAYLTFFVLLTFFGLIFSYEMAGLRIEFMRQSGIETSNIAWFIRLMGVLLFLATVLLTYILSNHEGKLKSLYCTVLSQLHKTDRKVQRAQRRISKIRLSVIKEQNKVQKTLEDQRKYINEERPEEFKDVFKEATDMQNMILALSTKNKHELIHASQSKMYQHIAVMEEKNKESDKGAI